MMPTLELPRRDAYSPRVSMRSKRSLDVVSTCFGHRAKAPRRIFPDHWRVSVFLAVVMSLVACGPVRLVSPYDEVMDRGASDVYTRIVAFVDKMTPLAGKPEGAYAANTVFYADLKASVAALQLRASVQGKNEITVALVKELATNVDNLKRLHEMSKDAGLPSILAGPALSALEVNCGAIIRFEVAKRRGTSD